MRNKGWKWLFVMMLISGLLVLLAGSDGSGSIVPMDDPEDL